jgi:hypothetical protein
MAVTTNITVVLGVTPCSLVTNYRRFGGMFRLLTRYSKILVNICQITRSNISGDSIPRLIMHNRSRKVAVHGPIWASPLFIHSFNPPLIKLSALCSSGRVQLIRRTSENLKFVFKCIQDELPSINSSSKERMGPNFLYGFLYT